MVSEKYQEIIRAIAAHGLDIGAGNDMIDIMLHVRDDDGDFDQNSQQFCLQFTKPIKDNWFNKLIATKDTKWEDLYRRVLLFEARYVVDSYFRFLDFDKAPARRFYFPRARTLKPIINAYQDLYNGKLDLLAVSQPKRTGKSTSACRLVTMMSGRKPECGTLATGAGDTLVTMFYDSVLDTFKDPAFLEVWPGCDIVKTKADTHNIDLREHHTFTTFQARSVDGSVVGNTEAKNLLYLDDMVKNHEEAMNRNRLDFLNEKVSGDILGRRIEGTPILIQGTRYSLYDPIGMLIEKAKMLGWRYRVIAIPALDPVTDESNFECIVDGKRIFTTKFYQGERKIVPAETWAAEFQQEPFEAKGRMFPEEDLNFYYELPVDIEPDAIVAACDPAGSGEDSTAMPIGFVYGDDIYIEDVVFDNSGANITKPECATKLMAYKVQAARFESNNAGQYYARDVDDLIKDLGGHCSITTKRSISNKMTRIETVSDDIKKHFYFKDRSLVKVGSQYYDFMREVVTLTRSGKNAHDDAPDSLAMLEVFMREKTGSKVSILSRTMLGI